MGIGDCNAKCKVWSEECKVWNVKLERGLGMWRVKCAM